LTRLFDVEPTVTTYPEQVSRKIWRDYPAVLDLA
jgi:para-nitrobenzyl esterase